MTPGAVPERHRELVPHAGLTGNARFATGAQCRSRGPCHRAMARWRTADRGQCVSARGRNSNVGSAESASFAAWIRRERLAGPRGSQRGAITLGRVLKAPVVEPPETTSPLGADDARGASPPPRFEREGRGWPMVKPWTAPLSTNHRRQKRHGEASPFEGLAFSCAMHAGRQLDRAEAMPVSCRNGALASAKTAV